MAELQVQGGEPAARHVLRRVDRGLRRPGGGGRRAAVAGASLMRPGLILVIVPLVILAVAWVVFCLHDLARADWVRYLPKWAWAIVCLISIPWGGLLYVIFGRDR
jgi:hypothetical protein